MRILVVDDDENIVHSLSWLLKKNGLEVDTALDGKAGVSLALKNKYDVVFLDVMMPGIDGLQALEKLADRLPALKVFMISGHADLSVAVKATRLGAYDFLEKPLNPEKVLIEIKKLREQVHLKNHVDRLQEMVEFDHQMLGISEAMRALKATIEIAAPSEGRILIYGENGTGKELVSREIHDKSRRALFPFIQLNCAALPRELIESELFGYEKGAFTGAQKAKPGLIEQAEGGSLLLDEVGDMMLETQAKLLRVLQENTFYRVGGTTPHRFDVRILAATNKNLEEEIVQGRFRQDLYYRLNVIPIVVPPLRERQTDIPLLARHFLSVFCHKNHKAEKNIADLAIKSLHRYSWPGNIRELKNTMERLAIMVQEKTIQKHHVDSVLSSGSVPEPFFAETQNSLSLKEQMNGFERALLQQTYDRCEGNVSQMAKVLKTDRANLYRKLVRYQIKTH